MEERQDLISRQAAIDAVEFGITYAKAIDVNTGESKELFKEGNDALKKAVERIKDLSSAQPEPQWIPCSERLPEEHIGFYLVTIQKRRITALNVVGCDNMVYDIDIARWDYDRRAPQRGYHWCKADKIIAWKPLPEPYRAERRTDGV